MRIGLDEAVIPNLEFPVRGGNNSFTINEGGGNLTVTVPPGAYNATTFCSALKTALDLAGALTYTCTYSLTTNYLTISATGNFSMNVSSGRFWEVSGFPQSYNGGSVLSHTGSMPMRLDGDEYLILEFLNVSNDNLVSMTPSSSVLNTIPIDKSWGNIIFYKGNPANNFCILQNEDMSELRVRLLDPREQIVNFPDNAYVFLKFRCFSDMFGAPDDEL